jgi:hypothetical protein
LLSKFHTKVIAPILILAGAFAFAGASWSGEPFSINMPHINHGGQVRTDSVGLTLLHDASCSIEISIAQAGDHILKSGGSTLATSYKLTGPALLDGDANWVAADDFLLHTYHIPGSGPVDTLTLQVQAAPSNGGAPDAGTYSASLVVTVTW